MENLALKYRPRRFEDLHGQRAAQVILRHMVTSGSVPAALLFQGGSGTGKTTTARIVAAALNCDAPPGPCGACVSCKSIFEATSLDVLEIDAASNGLVEDMRALCRQVLYRVSAPWRVIIVDEAHSCSGAAFNAMLKTLEELPPETLFILCTTEAHRIPDTVTNRCMPFEFTRIAVAEIVARLNHIAAAEHLSVTPQLLTLIAQRANGALRPAIMTLDQVARVGIDTVDAFTALLGEPDYAVQLLGRLAAGDTAGAFELLDTAMAGVGEPAVVITHLLGVCKDLMRLHAGTPLSRDSAATAARDALAGTLAPPTVLGIMRVLWELPARTRIGVDTRSAIELAVAMIADLITRHRPAVPPAAAPAARLNLAQMRALAHG